MDSLTQVCEAVLGNIEQNVSSTIFSVWFRDLKLEELTNEEAVFSIANDFKRGIIEERYAETIKKSLTEIIGFPLRIKVITIAPENNENPVRMKPITTGKEIEEKKPYEPVYDLEDDEELDIAQAIESNMIIEDYTFENFIVGETNKLAHAACQAVATFADEDYNPLFIWGPSGLGKTHLLYAVTNSIKKNNPNVKIIYKKGEEFTNELVYAIANGTTLSFREKYRSADVLLIDDVQFIAGRESTQEEFFHTFSTLYEAGKQIILTSDRPPKEMRTLEERIRTRFEWGLMADIQPPSFELRTAIIMKKAEQLNISLSPDIVNMLAEKLQNNVRQIEGALKKIGAISVLTATPITLDMCKRTISDFLAGPISVSDTVNKILRAVSEKYNVSIEDIKGTKKNEAIANARHVATYIIRTLTDLPLTQVADIFNRNYATAISSIKKVETDMREKKDTEYEIEEIINSVRS